MNDPDIEKALRKTPPIRTPAGLREELQRDIELPREPARITSRPGVRPGGWIPRWLPGLAFGVWFLLCAIVFAIQAARISQLRAQTAATTEANRLAAEQAQAAGLTRGAREAELDQLRRDASDAERLRAEVQQLRAATQELAILRRQNQELRDDLKAQNKLPPKPEEDFFASAVERASRIRCVNNLKQVALAARIWANDHGDHLPADYESMKRELNNDKITFCPQDETTRYEILSPGASESQPEIVYVRCSIHNIVGLVDGSVQQITPAQLVQRDGKWILVRNAEFE